MTDQDNLRDRIAAAIERGFNESANLNDYEAETLAMAQAIIDEFELTANGDDCGYHEIHGSYDTRFEDWEKQ